MELDLKEIKNLLGELNRKLDALVRERETLAMAMLSERSLKDFLMSEPDLYSARDLKVVYE
jgi:hypothetical protein